MPIKFQDGLGMSESKEKKIIGLNLFHIKVPMTERFKISSGEVFVKDAIIVELKIKFGDEILYAFGEASPMAGSFYSSETPDSVWEELVRYSGIIKDFNFDNFFDGVENLSREMINLGLSSYARAGIETALWDGISRIKGEPIFKIIGGEMRKIESGLAVGICDSVEDLIKIVGKHLDSGNYKRVKIKIQKGWDIVPIKYMLKNFSDVPLMVDANCAYLRDDIEHLRKLDDFGLVMIEQPLSKDDLEGHAALQDKISTPICLDESVDSIERLEFAIKLGACRIVNIKIQRVGGIFISKKFHDICRNNGIPVWIGTMPEIGIGSAHALNLCVLDNCKFPTDVESSSRWYVDDVIEPLIDVKDGYVNFTEDLSFGLNFEKVSRYMVKRLEINF